MCYSIPGRIVELKGNVAVIDYFGESRTAINELPDANVGDYVYAQGGILVQKIDAKEAEIILKEWKDAFFRLKKLDSEISANKMKGGETGRFGSIIKKAMAGARLGNDKLLPLLRTNKEKEIELLLKTANSIRQEVHGNSCCVHGILEFSNYCRNNCLYCGIRKGNKELKRYRMSPAEIIEAADNAVNKLGFKALVLQSGEDLYYTAERLAGIIKRIREKCGVLLFMSIGDRSFSTYKKMYKAGARGILLRFESSNPKLYKKIHLGPKSDLKKRIALLKYAKKIGYIISTGALIGLPEQKEQDVLADILLAESLGAEMYSFGPLIPSPKTPMADCNPPKISDVLKAIAVARLADRDAKILVTTALETLDRNGAKSGMLSGANSLMVNITPAKYRELYSIYPGRAGADKKAEEKIKDVLGLLYSLGRAPTDIGI